MRDFLVNNFVRSINFYRHGPGEGASESLVVSIVSQLQLISHKLNAHACAFILSRQLNVQVQHSALLITINKVKSPNFGHVLIPVTSATNLSFSQTWGLQD